MLYSWIFHFYKGRGKREVRVETPAESYQTLPRKIKYIPEPLKVNI